jgi:glutathione peroxidase
MNKWLWVFTGVLAGTLSHGSSQAQSQGTTPTACPALLRHTFPKLQDESPQNLCQYSGKVLLVVNTASYCGFTHQYEGLEALHEKYKAKGLVVLGFPSNNFGQQEPGNSKEIADFCFNTYGVKFPMLAKSEVTGKQRNAFYAELDRITQSPPRWNFHKYLIDRSGQKVLAYSSFISPQSSDLVKAIEQALAADQPSSLSAPTGASRRAAQ